MFTEELKLHPDRQIDMTNSDFLQEVNLGKLTTPETRRAIDIAKEVAKYLTMSFVISNIFLSSFF